MYISKGDSIFVTGHNGMVGSAICRALISHGYKNILTVGIAFSFQKYNNLPVNKNDFQLNYIITEKGIF